MPELKTCATFAAVALICLRLSAQTAPGTTAIVGGTVIDGTGGPPIADAVVLLAGGKVSAIGPRRAVTIPPGTAEIDARGRWIIPGMIDNLRKVSMVFKDGRIVDRSRLPEVRVLSVEQGHR